MPSLPAPHLEILPPPQRRLWDELHQVPAPFVLYGGTAIALRLGHRQSVDFDFSGQCAIDALTFSDSIEFLKGAQVLQRDRNTLTALVERGGPVQVSFFGVPALPRLLPPDVVPSNGLQVASLIDLAGTKASVVQIRGEAKDYLDIDALIGAGIPLPQMLTAARMLYGASFNPQITLKALSYYADGNLTQLPNEVKSRLAAAARETDLDHLPESLMPPGQPR